VARELEQALRNKEEQAREVARERSAGREATSLQNRRSFRS